MFSIQRRLGLLVLAVLAVGAFVAPGMASATVVKDTNGNLCPAVSPPINTANPQGAYILPQEYVSGGCTVHVKPDAKFGTTVLRAGPLGVEEHCFLEYDIHIGPDGWGYADNFKYTGGIGLPSCNYYGTWKGGFTSSVESQTIGPKGVNPSGMFSAENANTDFNALLAARESKAPSELGYQAISLDVSSGGLLVMENQYQGPGGFGTGSFKKGKWNGNAGLIVTH